MAFGTNFLPTPNYWQAFRRFVQLQCIGKSSEIMQQHSEALDKALYEIKKEGFTDEEAEIWTRNAMAFPGWGEMHDSPHALLEAIEAHLDAVEAAL